jgi:hypothetical protein
MKLTPCFIGGSKAERLQVALEYPALLGRGPC